MHLVSESRPLSMAHHTQSWLAPTAPLTTLPPLFLQAANFQPQWPLFIIATPRACLHCKLLYGTSAWNRGLPELWIADSPSAFKSLLKCHPHSPRSLSLYRITLFSSLYPWLFCLCDCSSECRGKDLSAFFIMYVSQSLSKQQTRKRSTEGSWTNRWRVKETHEAWWGPQKVSSPPLGTKGRRDLCPPKAESCAKEEELPTTPMLRQGGSGKQGKLSNFFLLPPSDFLPVFPTGSQRAREPGWCSPWLSGSWGTAQSSKECGVELDENGPTITSPVLVRGGGSTLVEWVNEWMNKENRRERDSNRICFNNFLLWARHPI